jgi:cytochrome P450
MTLQSIPNQAPLPLPPAPAADAGRRALGALLSGAGILGALSAMHAELGTVFRLPVGNFSPIFLVGPEANRFLTVTARDDFRWRPSGDPVSKLLGDGLLMLDGPPHDAMRRRLTPPLHKARLEGYDALMLRLTDAAISSWTRGSTLDMLPAMRRLALQILVESLFAVDVTPDLPRLWPDVLRLLAYISPGAWLVFPNLPRFGYGGAQRRMNAYLYGLIQQRRAQPTGGDDMLSALVAAGDLSDELIRDQLLTMLIAGHDTSTALLAWTIYLLGAHPEVGERARREVLDVLGGAAPTAANVGELDYLGRVIQETLRLYPPIHIGNRIAARDLEFGGYRLPAGARVVYSIYLTHRQPENWPEPERFDPDRFLPEVAKTRPPYSYVPFGSGPRMCIGAAFAQVESKIVLARLLQRTRFTLAESRVHAHMGATLEPRPGVRVTFQTIE